MISYKDYNNLENENINSTIFFQRFFNIITLIEPNSIQVKNSSNLLLRNGLKAAYATDR